MSNTSTDAPFDDLDEPATVPTLTGSRFRVIHTLGSGSAGVVVRAADTLRGGEVALKVLRGRSPASLERLKSEYRARFDVTHDNLLSLHELIVEDDVAYITMDLAPGGDLLTAMRASTARADLDVCAIAAQLLGALHALHDARLVHRDVKPANVLVDGARVLLADFGLTCAVASNVADAGAAADGAGTPRYMAPELSLGAPASPASDIYSLGVSLRELVDAVGLPTGEHRLVTLLGRMTAPDPRVRPSAAEALRSLTPADAPARRTSLRAPVAGRALVGRARELAALARAGAGGPAVFHVQGPSGMGKSALVHAFLARDDGGAAGLALRGRCLPGEHLGHRGFDGVVHALCGHLRGDPAPLDALPEAWRQALATLFPELRVFGGVALATPAGDGGARDLRLRAWEGLRALLDTLCASRPITLWIDDLQWADDDTLDLLRFLLAEDRMPPVVAILSYRWEGATRERLGRIRPAGPPSAWGSLRAPHTLVEVGPLSLSETRDLLRSLHGGAVEAASLERLAEEAQGVPMFAWALARDGANGPAHPGADAVLTRLAEAIRRSVAALPEAQRRALDAVAAAEEPVPARLVAAAVGRAGCEYDIEALVRSSFIDRLDGDTEARYGPIHDHVRQACRALLDAARLGELHGALGAAYERHLPGEHAALAHHWAAAGQLPAAGRHASLAGDAARAQLAFGAAAQHYERALRWLPAREVTPELARRHAEALADQGLAREAAVAFASAAAATAVDGTDRLSLQLRVAEQRFHAGDTDEGYAALRDVLGACGVALPDSRAASLAAAAALRARFVWRGVSSAGGDEAERSPRVRVLLDALWTGASCLAHVNHVLGDVLMLRHLHLALDAGSPSRVARSIAFEAAAEVAFGGRYLEAHAEALFERARALAERSPERAYDVGWFHVSRASAEVFRGDWRRALDHSERAAAALADARSRGVSWELAINHLYGLTALAMMGRVDALAARHAAAWEDAAARRDSLAANHCRSGFGAMLWLYRDEVGACRAEARRALGVTRWAGPLPAAARARWPSNIVSTPDYHNLVAAAQLALYEGDGALALEAVDRLWPAVGRAMLLRVGFVSADLHFLRGRALVAAARTAGPGWRGRAAARALLHRVEGEVDALRGDGHRAARPHALLLSALAAAPRDRVGAAAALEAAGDAYEATGMAAHAAAARARARALCAGARRGGLDALRGLGMARPERVAELLAPTPPG